MKTNDQVKEGMVKKGGINARPTTPPPPPPKGQGARCSLLEKEKTMETISSETIKEIVRYDVSLKKIHPNILKGLIPVDAPAFIGLDGEAKGAKVECVDDANGIEYQPGSEDTNNIVCMAFLGKCINRAKELNWEYIYRIAYDYDTNTKTISNVKIRGC